MSDYSEKMFSFDNTPKNGYVQVVDGSDQISIFWYLLSRLENMKKKSPSHLCAKTSNNHIMILTDSIHQTLENVAQTRLTRIQSFIAEGYPGLREPNFLAISYHPRESERNPPQLIALCLNTLIDMLEYFPDTHLPAKHGTICANDMHEALEEIPMSYKKENAEAQLTPP